MDEANFLREPSADAYEEPIIFAVERGIAKARRDNVQIQTIELHTADRDDLCDSIRARARTPMWNPANCRGFTFDGIPVEANPTCQRGCVYLVLTPPTEAPPPKPPA